MSNDQDSEHDYNIELHKRFFKKRQEFATDTSPNSATDIFLWASKKEKMNERWKEYMSYVKGSNTIGDNLHKTLETLLTNNVHIPQNSPLPKLIKKIFRILYTFHHILDLDIWNDETKDPGGTIGEIRKHKKSSITKTKFNDLSKDLRKTASTLAHSYLLE